MNSARILENIRVVLVRTSHPGNIGAAARAMKTMGLSDLVLVRPRSFPHADADARASSAIDVLARARVCEDLVAALNDCVLAVATSSRYRELPHPTLDARAAAYELTATAATDRVALVFGGETAGLTNDEARRCQVWATITANPEYASLNLAAAVQVFAYELRVAAGLPFFETRALSSPATLEQVEQLHVHFEQTMVHAGFHDPANPKRLIARLRRLFARARLEAEEVNIVRGFLSAVDKMRR